MPGFRTGILKNYERGTESQILSNSINMELGLQAEEMWDDQRRDGKSFRRILEAERTSWPKP
jgi:hypothetical protein